ncbi:MAG: glucose-6-phosphate isomerase, partial [Candidatus Azotimanducaceae bacterium]
MDVTYSEKRSIQELVASLEVYRAHTQSVFTANDFSQPESSLVTATDTFMKDGVNRVVSEIGAVRHVVLIGIGGSSLGTEAIHAALGSDVRLHVLDAVAPYRITEVVESLKDVPKSDIAICAISKSGGTTETLTNTTVLLDELGKVYGEQPYDRLVCIGNPNNALLEAGKALGARTLAMHEVVGGRYSVFTAVGLVP